MEPTLTPEQALTGLRRQLEVLQEIKNRSFQEAEKEEGEWRKLTENIIEFAFGKPSASLSKFRKAVDHFSVSFAITDFLSEEEQHQENFEVRIRESESLLRILIEILKLQLPEEEGKSVYEAGESYYFYRDLNSHIAMATNDVFIVDAYIDEELFNLYVSKVPNSATVRILSKKTVPNVETVAKKYVQNRLLELRSSKSIHDRLVFVDQRGWVIGQSIKDAAHSKPTYLIKLNEPSLTAVKDTHNKIWEQAKVII